MREPVASGHGIGKLAYNLGRSGRVSILVDLKCHISHLDRHICGGKVHSVNGKRGSGESVSSNDWVPGLVHVVAVASGAQDGVIVDPHLDLRH